MHIYLKSKYVDFILATCMLHNFITETDNNYTVDFEDNTNRDKDQAILQNLYGGNSTYVAFAVAETFTKFYGKYMR